MLTTYTKRSLLIMLAVLLLNGLVSGAEVDQNVPAKVKGLIAKLDSEDVEVRKEAIFELAKLGPEAKPAYPYLMAMGNDPDLEIKKYVALALPEIVTQYGPEIRNAIRHEDAQVRLLGLLMLRNISNARMVLPELIELLKNEDMSMRLEILLLLGQMGVNAKIASHDVVVLLKDSNDVIRVSAANKLGDVGIGQRCVANALCEAMGDPHILVRRGAAESIGTVGVSSNKIIMALKKHINDDNDGIMSIEAALSLTKIEPKEKTGLHRLTDLLKAKNPVIRFMALEALGDIGPGASQALPQIKLALKDDDKRVVVCAVYALAKIEPTEKSHMKKLISYLDDSQEGTGLIALRLIAKYGLEASEAVDAIVVQMQSEDGLEPDMVTFMLGEMGIAAKGAIPALEKALETDDFQSWSNVKRALRDIERAEKAG